MVEVHWYKILNPETHEVLVAFGDDEDWFISMGYTLHGEVEQAYDDRWYEKGYAPKEPPLPELEAYKEQRKIELNTLHEAAEKEAHILSSLGFEVDANDRANRDLAGLLVTTGEDEIVNFCDYSNVMHQITRDQLAILQEEIIKNAQSLYAQKWSYREEIEGCMSSEELKGVVIQFHYMSFYKGE